MCLTSPISPASRLRVNLILLGIVIGHFVVAVHLAAQSQDVINAMNGASIEHLSRRLGDLERLDIGTRLKVLEEAMAEVKWLTRGVALAVLGQLVSRILDLRQFKVR